MMWLPRHRLPITLSQPWPRVALPLVRRGFPWLHTGLALEGEGGGDLLGFPRGHTLASRWVQGAWRTTLNGHTRDSSPWQALQEAVAESGRLWVGAASFELACDEASMPRQAVPEGTLGQSWVALDQALWVQQGRAELLSWKPAPPRLEDWSDVQQSGPAPAPAPVSLQLRARWSESQHKAAVEAIREQIFEGGFYVANLCVPFEGTLTGDPGSLAMEAFKWARPPFGALLDLGDQHLLSLSMERLLSRRGGCLRSQPIKGSAPFTGDSDRDSSAAEAMAADPKERAEHTMIVDLVRNDLGRVARTGSVTVTRSMAVEPYPTVQHLVSTVEATARPGLGLADLLRAVLPGGSVTGAPKHAVCTHLAKAEAGPRGFYCGAHGWIGPNGDLDLALPIRTAQILDGRLTYLVGGGITWRSDPGKEWAELHLKTRALTGV
jgi:anthranilate/para-aminobenzoate synthase component I